MNYLDTYLEVNRQQYLNEFLQENPHHAVRRITYVESAEAAFRTLERIAEFMPKRALDEMIRRHIFMPNGYVLHDYHSFGEERLVELGVFSEAFDITRISDEEVHTFITKQLYPAAEICYDGLPLEDQHFDVELRNSLVTLYASTSLIDNSTKNLQVTRDAITNRRRILKELFDTFPAPEEELHIREFALSISVDTVDQLLEGTLLH